MHDMELDHIFIFTPKPGNEADCLVESGLVEGPGNKHPGQGTANRRFFFKNCYLEILWVENEEELMSEQVAPSMLWQRSGTNIKKASPFGLCLSNTIDTNPVFKNAIKYNPPYFSGDMTIDVIANINAPGYPWVFRLPPEIYSNTKPKKPKYPINDLFVSRVIFAFPAKNKPDPGMEFLGKERWIAFEQGPDFHLTMEFDNGKQGEKVNLMGTLPLSLHF